MSGEPPVYLNLGVLHRPWLFVAARSLNGEDEPRGPSLVLAQAAVEVAMETATDFALQLREVHDPLREWVGTTVFSWSPTNKRVQALWTALTGDRITAAPGWAAYKQGTELRHAFVHRMAAVPRDQAEEFIAAAEQVVTHIVNVMTKEFSDSAAE